MYDSAGKALYCWFLSYFSLKKDRYLLTNNSRNWFFGISLPGRTLLFRISAIKKHNLSRSSTFSCPLAPHQFQTIIFMGGIYINWLSLLLRSAGGRPQQWYLFCYSSFFWEMVGGGQKFFLNTGRYQKEVASPSLNNSINNIKFLPAAQRHGQVVLLFNSVRLLALVTFLAF